MTKDATPSTLDLTSRIFEVRGGRVLFDETLAMLYGVSTKAFNQAVRRNRDRFPEDFLVELTEQEWEISRSQFVTPRKGPGALAYFKLRPLRLQPEIRGEMQTA